MSSKKIVHVDNSEFFRKQMRTFLAGEGFEVESFESAQDAGMAIGGGNLDMVIMGLTFADIDGEAFIQRVLEDYSGPVIVVSSSIDREKETRLIDMGLRAAINKSGRWQESLKPHLAALKKA